MAKQGIQKINRISKSQGRLMVAVAFLFDLIPIILLCLVFYFILDALGGFNTLTDAFDTGECKELTVDMGATGLDLGRDTITVCENETAFAKVKLLFALSGAISGTVFTGPLVYSVGSFMATFFGYMCFTIWFAINKVNMWSFSKTGRVFANAFSALIELVPLLNLLPGITFMAWRHVKITQAEDELKNRESLKNSLRVIKGGGRSRRFAKTA